MYSFKVYITKNGKSELIDGSPVFPFAWAELLDERLDEADLVLFNSTTVEFERTTDVHIELYEGKTKKLDLYYIISSDHSVKYPIWGSTYKHEIHLIERTKLLEGIICPSLTFTNALGVIYDTSKIASRVYASGDNLTSSFEGIDKITSPIHSAWDYTAVSIKEVGEKYVEALKAENAYWQYVYSEENDKNAKLSVYIDDEFILSHTDNSSELNICSDKLQNRKHLKLVYTFTYYRNTGDGGLANFNKTITFNLGIVSDVMPIKRITITDAVNRILRCAEPLISPRTKPRYTFNDEQAAKYENVFAPEFTLTQSTLREQLKTVGAFIHAEPWIDESNVVYFKEYALAVACPLDDEPYVYDGLQSDINEYNTSLYSDAQNLVQTDRDGTRCYFPSSSVFIAPRTETCYVRFEDNQKAIYTNEKIHSIHRVYCRLYVGDKFYQTSDIGPYIFEFVEYNNNLSSFDSAYPYSKSWAIYYTTGTNVIDGLFYTAEKINANAKTYAIANIFSACSEVSLEIIQGILETNPESLAFVVEYTPIGTASISHGKQKFVKGQAPFAKFYNQGENEVEARWYGENIKGAAARLGNIDVERTYILSSLDNLPGIGQRLDGYVISATSFELTPYVLKCTVSLTSDFNRLSEYIGVSSVKRMYEISERQITQRKIHIHRTLVFGNADGIKNLDKNSNIFPIVGFSDIFVNGKPDEVYLRYITNAVVYTKGYDNEEHRVMLPIISGAMGNLVTFSFSFKDNFSAGDKLEQRNVGNISGHWTADVPYTDFYGKVKECKVFLLTQGVLAKNVIGKSASLSKSLPEIKSVGESSLTDEDIYFTHEVDKDNREILSYTIEVEAKTTFDDIVIGSGLSKLCSYVYANARPIEYTPPIVYLTKDPIDKFASVIDSFETRYTVLSELEFAEKTDFGFILKLSDKIYNSLNSTYKGVIIATPTTKGQKDVLVDGKVISQEICAGGDIIFQIDIELSGGKDAIWKKVNDKIKEICFYIESE